MGRIGSRELIEYIKNGCLEGNPKPDGIREDRTAATISFNNNGGRKLFPGSTESARPSEQEWNNFERCSGTREKATA